MNDKPTSIRLPAQMRVEIEALAKAGYRSMASVILELLAEALKAHAGK